MDYKKINRSSYAAASAVKNAYGSTRYAGSVSARTVMNNAGLSVKPEKQLAMVYAPYQYFEDLYPAEKGFFAGTIFMHLDLPCTACTSCRMHR